MKNFVIQNRKIFVAVCVAVILCVVTVLHFAEPQEEQIPKLKLPVVGNIATANIRVSIEDTIESEIDNVSQSLTVYCLKPVNLNQEKKKIGELFQISSSDIGAFPTGNTLPDGTTVGIDAQTGRWFYQKPIDLDAKEGVLSDTDAIQIAEQFIADNDLYPLKELGDAKVGTTSTGDAAQGTEEVLRKNVYFYPEIAGKPVYGTFRICISISGSGEIVGVDKFANEYALVDADVEGKNYHEVATSLSENDYTLNAEVAPNSILIDSVSDAFYADPESEYIQPIYVLEGSGENQTEKYDIWMDARSN